MICPKIRLWIMVSSSITRILFGEGVDSFVAVGPLFLFFEPPLEFAEPKTVAAAVSFGLSV